MPSQKSHPRERTEGYDGEWTTSKLPALALVSTWLCLLSASQRATEWGSIETNSLCHRQLMGFPRMGKKKKSLRQVFGY